MNTDNFRYKISKYSIYVFLFCLLFLVQREILMFFFDVKKYILFEKIYVYEIILSIIVIFEINKCIKISRLE